MCTDVAWGPKRKRRRRKRKIGGGRTRRASHPVSGDARGGRDSRRPANTTNRKGGEGTARGRDREISADARRGGASRRRLAERQGGRQAEGEAVTRPAGARNAGAARGPDGCATVVAIWPTGTAMWFSRPSDRGSDAVARWTTYMAQAPSRTSYKEHEEKQAHNVRSRGRALERSRVATLVYCMRRPELALEGRDSRMRGGRSFRAVCDTRSRTVPYGPTTRPSTATPLTPSISHSRLPHAAGGIIKVGLKRLSKR